MRFAFYMIVLIIVGLYAVVVKIICGTTGEGMSQIACIVARLHNSFLGTAIIVTILLLNIILEVKILKFFLKKVLLHVVYIILYRHMIW